MAGVVQIKLADLSTDISNAVVTAIVISKSEPNVFFDRNSGDFRGVITFTIRDSKLHITNCKFWGSKKKVEEYNRIFHINDLIDVICPRIVPLPSGDNLFPDEFKQPRRFQPLSTTAFLLVLNEGNSFIEKHIGDVEICRYLWELARVPHKSLSAVLNLADIRSNDKNSQGQFVDLLVVVANLRPVKDVRSTRTGQTLNCLELVVFDRSTPGGMVLTIWSYPWIKKAQQFWLPMKTILHLIDVRVGFSEFYRMTILNFTACSLIYENPIGREADDLATFAKTVPISDIDVIAQGDSGSLPNAEQITTIMTVKQIYARAEGILKDDSDQITALLLGMVSKFDIDGQSKIIGRKCKSCNRTIFGSQIVCDFDQCQMAFSFNYEGEKFDYFFNINIHLSDHTGTLIEPRLSSAVAERILGISVADFQRLDEVQKEQLKWTFLMDHFEVKMLIKKKTAVRKNLAILIVDMQKISLEEISKRIVVF